MTHAFTSLDKVLWPQSKLQKKDYLHYLHTVALRMLPFLHDRPLTLKRLPNGITGESFYQKNCPDYAPPYIQTYYEDDNHYIISNDLQTLLWLGNQLAIEFHIPFQTIHSSGPSEIVFDLDPPSRAAFPLAVKAALMIKDICDSLKLTSFVKTSGNKGLQVYIPLPDDHYTFAETRLFTEFTAAYLTSKEPKFFTTERLKKNRGSRLYVDYVQHARGKTIIAPYSLRINEGPYAAAPLHWEEVNDDLSIEQFTIREMVARIEQGTEPFASFLAAKENQPFTPVVDWLKKTKS